MKNLFLKLGEPINAVGNFGAGIVGTTNNNQIIENKVIKSNSNELNELEIIFRDLLIPEFIQQNEELFQKLSNLIQNTNNSSLKIMRDEISDSEIKLLLTNFLKLAKDKKVINDEQYNKAISKLDKYVASFKAKFRTTIREQQAKLKEEKKQEKIIKQELSKKYQQIVTDQKKGYSVNISVDKDKLEENSKVIGIKYLALEKQLDSLKKISINNLEILKSYEQTIIKLNRAIIGMSAVSIISTIFVFFWPPAAIGSIAAGATVIGLTITLENFKKEYEIFVSRNKVFENVSKAIEEAKITKTPLLDNLLTFGVGVIVGKIDLLNNLYSLPKGGVKEFAKFKKDIIKNFKTPSGSLSLVLGAAGIALDGYTIYTSAADINRADIMINEINNFTSNLRNTMSEIIDGMKSLGWVRWVVINETPIYGDDYDTCATGGKNLIFKNLITGEIKTLNELLSLSYEQLHIQGLTKVYNSKTNEWYIKTLPNNTKKDNLG
ncbi:hypothetical protein [Mycoplasmopsis verecunda]|uniref:Uncharacterized protein n=2 Tax=Mycoplasmopsis verecunda TaxID=171291 RepID=A0A1T4KJQ2_9BACT|nr:hypothetical protein [Mycoplasmopsis verecunda]SJZ42607.1 hypothetical protein SAMN02745154_00073 [Mycoplasmopsis verecunda]